MILFKVVIIAFLVMVVMNAYKKSESTIDLFFSILSILIGFLIVISI